VPGRAVHRRPAGRGSAGHRRRTGGFADWLRGFGNLLIIDHGGSYMSLYGNNERCSSRSATRSAAATRRHVGNSGGNADSGLYFEMRHQGGLSTR
jgi:septal ring factor EnvC (AmiA/AmiB activator)